MLDEIIRITLSVGGNRSLSKTTNASTDLLRRTTLPCDKLQSSNAAKVSRAKSKRGAGGHQRKWCVGQQPNTP